MFQKEFIGYTNNRLQLQMQDNVFRLIDTFVIKIEQIELLLIYELNSIRFLAKTVLKCLFTPNTPLFSPVFLFNTLE